jgi:hypothetical protein
MIFEIPDGVAQSFALAAVSVAVGADPVFGPDRIELAGRIANPIEQVFAKFKTLLRKAEART